MGITGKFEHVNYSMMPMAKIMHILPTNSQCQAMHIKLK